MRSGSWLAIETRNASGGQLLFPQDLPEYRADQDNEENHGSNSS
jgi:hypothetical protein